MKNNQKGFANIVLVGVLVLVIFGGYLLLKNSTPADKEIPASQTTDETASWKTYTNSEYGFEFKYPSDYLRKESSIYFSEEIPEGTKVSVESPTCKTLVTGGGPWPKDCVSYNLLIQKNKISAENLFYQILSTFKFIK